MFKLSKIAQSLPDWFFPLVYTAAKSSATFERPASGKIIFGTRQSANCSGPKVGNCYVLYLLYSLRQVICNHFHLPKAHSW